MSLISGKIIKLGDNIDTDIIIPTQYMTLRTISEMSKFAFEPIRPEMPKIVGKGDILVGGKNFGCGSSREQASLIIKELGFSCIIAKSFSRIFYRNAISNGIFVFENSDVYNILKEGDEVSFDTEQFKIILNTNKIKLKSPPKYFKNIIESGGIVQYWKKINS